jgi:FHA domain
MSVTCSNGHSSTDTQWCDVCGEKLTGGGSGPSIASAAATSTSSPSMSTGAQQPCPHCAELNAVTNLFCETCGYDFTTGQAPPTPISTPATSSSTVASATTTQPIPTATPVTGWIVIVEIDPDWFAAKGTDAGSPCPPASSSTVALAMTPALIGRTSHSKGVFPAIPLDLDPAVSRRQAQLVFEDDAWSVVDLGSSNGTYVLSGDQQPHPDLVSLSSGVPAPLADGARVYVGAWTKITLRSTSIK